MGFDVEMSRMNVGALARQQDAVNDVEQRPDIRDVGHAREHQGQGIGDIRHSIQIPFPGQLCGIAIIDEMPGSDDTNQWLWHHLVCALPHITRIGLQPACLKTVPGRANGSMARDPRVHRWFVKLDVLRVQIRSIVVHESHHFAPGQVLERGMQGKEVTRS